MAEDAAFAAFVVRLRAGDDEAARELVRRFESAVRREIRLRLTDANLRRVTGSSDVCQSVLASFFVRIASGQFEVDHPARMLALLLAMARKKLAAAARRHRALRRDGRRLEATPVDTLGIVGGGPPPCRVVAGRELLEEVRRRLSDEERDLADRRAQGAGWAEIAGELGGTVDGRRMQLTRALDRVSRELGLEGGDRV